MDDATVEILLKWRQENERVVDEVRAQLAALTVQTTAANAATNAGAAAAAGGAPAWLGIAAAVALAAIAFSPFVTVAGAAAVILTTFAVAGAGTLALLGGLAAGFAGLGAIVTLFGIAADSGTSAGRPGPFTTLLAQLNDLRGHFEEAARPIAYLIFQFVSGLLPAVRTVGDELFKWFGDRLPGMLSAISGILNDLTPDFEAFAKFLGATFDKIGGTSFGVGGTMSLLASTFEDGVRLMINAAKYLISNLTALSQWFLERLPTYGPIVQQVMGWVGTAVLGAATVIGNFADWLVANWPAIMENVRSAIKSISDAWNLWAPQLQPIVEKILPAMGEALKNISNHAGTLVPALMLIGTGVLLFAVGAMGLIGVIMQLVQWMDSLNTAWEIFTRSSANPFQNFITGVRDATDGVRNLIITLDQIPGVNIPVPSLGGQGGAATQRASTNRQRGFGNAYQ